jgi:glycerophosphoryl diester phosphodiesterase
MNELEPNHNGSKAFKRQVVRVGHRGAAGHAPENTLAAINAGIACGADIVEIDLRRTADGVLVALHDATVNRTTDGTGRIARLSLQDVKKLTAGKGQQIPTLQEVLDAAGGRAGLMLELKVRGIAGQVVNAVHQAGFKKPVIYASFLYDELPQVQEADPDADRMALFDRLPGPSVARATKYAASCVGLRHDRAARRLIESFHRSDLRVFVYTANRLVDIERALSLGVDGIISNFPDRIPCG